MPFVRCRDRPQGVVHLRHLPYRLAMDPLCGFLFHRPYLAVPQELWEEEDAADMDGDGRNEVVAASGMGSVFLLSRTME